MDPHKQAMLHASGDCLWRTEMAMVLGMERLAGRPFEIDLAATIASTVVVRREITHDLTGFDELAVFLGPDHPDKPLRDSLAVDWHTIAQVGFLNPPYSKTLYSQGLKAGTPRAQLQWMLIDSWAKKAYEESLQGFTTWAVMPYASQTRWFKRYVMGLTKQANDTGTFIGWSGHAALRCHRIPHRVSFLREDGSTAHNANVNTCIVHWGPNPGYVGPWDPMGPYWSYR